MIACLLDCWPMLAAIVACLLGFWLWGRNQRATGRLEGRTEVYQEQRHAREVRL